MSQGVWSSCDFAAGWASGICGLLVGHPLDTIKVRQQTIGIGIGRGVSVIAAICSTYKYEGIFGFYKGLLFPILSTGAINSLFFGVYGNTKRLLDELSFNSLQAHNASPSSGLLWNVFWAGCLGGTATVFLSCPIELAKSQLQVQTGNAENTTTGNVNTTEWKTLPRKAVFRGPFDCLRGLYMFGGFKTVYTGFVTLLGRDIISSGVYMTIYTSGLKRGNGSNHTLSVLIAGGVAGLVSWAMVVPVDVIKSRLQADNLQNPQYKGIVDCIRKSYQADGSGVFYRGLGIILVRAFPVNAVIFIAYETFISHCLK